MLINAYDTTVGKPFKVDDTVEATIKALHISRALVPAKKEGVFYVDYSGDITAKNFAFPVTTTAYNGKTITIYDERPYRSKSSNQIVNSNELTIVRLAAFLQQSVAEKDLSPLKKMRLVATKAFAESISARVMEKAGLKSMEALTLKILLSYYFVSLMEDQGNDLELVTINVCREVYGSDRGMVLGVIQEAEHIGHMYSIEHLVAAINSNPTLYKLKGYGLKDVIGAISGISYAALGSKIVGAACEAPCFFAAMVYAAVKFKSAYAKTGIGKALDPQYNKELLKNFTLNVDYIYDLG